MDCVLDRWVGFGQAAGEKAVRHAVILIGLEFGGGGHQSDSCKKLGELVDAALVAPAGEIGAEEGRDARLGHIAADQPRAECQHVGVVMFAGECGGQAGRRPARSGIADCG